MIEARFYETVENQKVQCHLCAHECKIDPGKWGICHVRQNREGTLYSLVYGRIIAENVDPIEKKPLFHFLPGSRSYSIATIGCNFMCMHCQNYDISQYPRRHEGRIIGEARTPQQIVDQALATRSSSISTSSGSTTAWSIVSPFTDPFPSTVALTIPPPAEADISCESSLSCSSATLAWSCCPIWRSC